MVNTMSVSALYTSKPQAPTTTIEKKSNFLCNDPLHIKPPLMVDYISDSTLCSHFLKITGLGL